MTASPEVAPDMWVSGMAVFLHHWYSDYAQARAHLEAQGGFLLPYRSYCFVACAEAIRELGLDPQDPDWARIGWDWLRPADRAAWERLRTKRELAA
jgi:hypothetical protein